MSGEFTFNGKSSAEFGLLVNNVNNFGAPSRVVEKIQVPYRNGDLLIDTGTYSNCTVTYEVSLIHNAVPNTRAIAEWLLVPQGYCELTDSYNTNEIRMAAFYGEINYVMSHLNRYGKATLNFDCKPQRYIASGQIPITFSSSDTLQNDYPFKCRPLIRLDSDGTCYIGNYEITAAFPSPKPVGFNHFMIDCETMQCFWLSGGIARNANEYVSLPQGFPVLEPGSNYIDLDTVSSVDITPRWWTI